MKIFKDNRNVPKIIVNVVKISDEEKKKKRIRILRAILNG